MEDVKNYFIKGDCKKEQPFHLDIEDFKPDDLFS